MRADNIAIENGKLTAAFEHERCEYLCGGTLSGTTQTGEPDAEALFMAGRVHLAQDLGSLGAGEPFG